MWMDITTFVCRSFDITSTHLINWCLVHSLVFVSSSHKILKMATYRDQLFRQWFGVFQKDVRMVVVAGVSSCVWNRLSVCSWRCWLEPVVGSSYLGWKGKMQVFGFLCSPKNSGRAYSRRFVRLSVRPELVCIITHEPNLIKLGTLNK